MADPDRGGTGFDRRTFTSPDLAAIRTGTEFSVCVFDGCDLTAGFVPGARFFDCEFRNCDFSNLKPDAASFQKARFVDCKMTGFDLGGCDKFLIDVAFEGCRLDFARFQKLPLKGTRFQRCGMRETDFSGADLSGSSFDGCDLSGAVFGGTNLEKADFRSARNYLIDPVRNRVRKAQFSLPEAAGLLRGFDVVIKPPRDDG
jgi:uncharacterized protein YjbI with pentapeptide repeats